MVRAEECLLKGIVTGEPRSEVMLACLLVLGNDVTLPHFPTLSDY